eukprot:4389223-Pleurochrysis_carterae.AAC.1
MRQWHGTSSGTARSGTGRTVCSTPRYSYAFRLAVCISLSRISDGDFGLAAGVVAVGVAGPCAAMYESNSFSLICKAAMYESNSFSLICSYSHLVRDEVERPLRKHVLSRLPLAETDQHLRSLPLTARKRSGQH